MMSRVLGFSAMAYIASNIAIVLMISMTAIFPRLDMLFVTIVVLPMSGLVWALGVLIRAESLTGFRPVLPWFIATTVFLGVAMTMNIMIWIVFVTDM